MKEKVVFDTNIVHNVDANTFLGGRTELERFASVADIIIPDTVIHEIKRQKRKKLKSNKDKFLTNPFHSMLGIDIENTKSFEVDEYIEKLMTEENIPFSVIDVSNNDVLPQIKDLAINKQAPFEKSDDTDKGFKDALIYFSVLEFLQQIPDKQLFVCAKDGRLREALDKHDNIIVISNYNEFKQKSISQFFDDYFIEKVNFELGLTITKENIIEYWHNLNENQILRLEIDGEQYLIEVDSMEIINSANKNDFSTNLQSLINSRNFDNTDYCIEELQNYSPFFSHEEIASLLNAAYSNSQIRWIIEKEAIKQFIGPLFLLDSHLIEAEKQEFFKEIFE